MRPYRMRGTVWSDCGWIHIIWIIKATYSDVYHTFVRFTLMITDTKAGFPDSVYDQMIVPDMFFLYTVILVLTEDEGKPVTGR